MNYSFSKNDLERCFYECPTGMSKTEFYKAYKNLKDKNVLVRDVIRKEESFKFNLPLISKLQQKGAN